MLRLPLTASLLFMLALCVERTVALNAPFAYHAAMASGRARRLVAAVTAATWAAVAALFTADSLLLQDDQTRPLQVGGQLGLPVDT